MTAARNKMSRWACEAAEREGVLANMLVEECIARVTKSWHETIEPQTKYARRCLGGVAEFTIVGRNGARSGRRVLRSSGP